MGFAFVAVTYLATKLSILLGCQPYSNNWRIYPNPGSTSATINTPLDSR